MPLYDYECERCGCTFEEIAKMDDEALRPCPKCPGLSHRLVSYGHGENVFRNEAPWLRTVLAVVAKDSDKPHTKTFLQSPTRENYHKWLRAEGIRPYEPGEARQARLDRQKAEEIFGKTHTDAVLRSWQKEKRIEI